MNANRKADLQRKLAVAPVPKPPAGLAERIKTEIPKELRFDIDRERDRFSRSVRFSLAVAASVIVVISSAFLALRVINTADQPVARRAAPATATAIPVPVAAPPPPPPVAVPEKQEAPKQLIAKRAKRQATRVLDASAKTSVVAAAPAAARMQSRDEQIRILKDRLAHGADPKDIIRAAREAGLNDFADELEKKKP